MRFYRRGSRRGWHNTYELDALANDLECFIVKRQHPVPPIKNALRAPRKSPFVALREFLHVRRICDFVERIKNFRPVL